MKGREKRENEKRKMIDEGYGEWEREREKRWNEEKKRKREDK